MLGQTDALVYFGSRREGRSGGYVVGAVLIATASAFVASIAFVLFAPFALGAQSIQTIHDAKVYMLIGPLFALVWLPFHILRGVGRLGEWNLFRLAPVIGWFAIVLVSFGLGVTSPRGLAMCYLVMTMLIGIAVWCRVSNAIAGPRWCTRPQVIQLLRYGMPAAGATLPQMMNLRLDQIFLAAVIAPQGLGLYVAAVAWSSAVLPATTALGLVLFPRLGALQPESRLSLVATSSRVGILVAGTGGVLAAISAPLAVPLIFGAEFREASATCVVLCVATIVYAWNYILEEGLRGLGRPSSPMRAQLFGLALSALGLLWLVPRMGIMGAAVASLAAYSMSALVNTLALRRSGASWRMLVLVRKSDLLLIVDVVRRTRRGKARVNAS